MRVCESPTDDDSFESSFVESDTSGSEWDGYESREWDGYEMRVFVSSGHHCGCGRPSRRSVVRSDSSGEE